MNCPNCKTPLKLVGSSMRCESCAYGYRALFHTGGCGKPMDRTMGHYMAACPACNVPATLIDEFQQMGLASWEAPAAVEQQVHAQESAAWQAALGGSSAW